MGPKRTNHSWTTEEDEAIKHAYSLGMTKGEQILDLPIFSQISTANAAQIDNRIKQLKKKGDFRVADPVVTPAHQNGLYYGHYFNSAAIDNLSS